MPTGKLSIGPGICVPGQLAICFRNHGLSGRSRCYMLPGVLPPEDINGHLQVQFSRMAPIVPGAWRTFRPLLQQVVDTVMKIGEDSNVRIDYQDQYRDACPSGLYLWADPIGAGTPWNRLSNPIETALKELIRLGLDLPHETEIPIRRFVSFRMAVDDGMNWTIQFYPKMWCETDSFGTHETHTW